MNLKWNVLPFELFLAVGLELLIPLIEEGIELLKSSGILSYAIPRKEISC